MATGTWIEVILYYLTTIPTGTGLAQGHTVLSGDHGYLSSALLVTSHKPTQPSNFALLAAEKWVIRQSPCTFRTAGVAQMLHGVSWKFGNNLQIRNTFPAEVSIPESMETRWSKMSPAAVWTSCGSPASRHTVQRQNGKWYLLGVHDPTIALISGDKHIPTPSLNCLSITKYPILFSFSKTVQQLTAHTVSFLCLCMWLLCTACWNLAPQMSRSPSSVWALRLHTQTLRCRTINSRQHKQPISIPTRTSYNLQEIITILWSLFQLHQQNIDVQRIACLLHVVFVCEPKEFPAPCLNILRTNQLKTRGYRLTAKRNSC